MIAVFVTFSADDGLDRERVSGVASESPPMFEGLEGLRAKAFTIDEDGRRARNFYLWEDEAKAREFFGEAMVDRIEGAYGVRPTIEFAEVVGFVDN